MPLSNRNRKLKTKLERQAQQITQLQEEKQNLLATLRIMGGQLELTNRREKDGVEQATLVVRIPLPASEGWRNGWEDCDKIEHCINVHRKKK